jgi:OOP family OmpA-OmpF porin
MSYRSALLCAGFLCSALPALADPLSGLYVGAGAGGNVPRSQGVERSLPGGYVGRLSTEMGPMGTASVGWGFGNGIRLELQGELREDGLRQAGTLRAGGEEVQLGGFVNGFYDIDFGNRLFGLTPYVGLGVGYERTSFDDGHAAGIPAGTPTSVYARTGSVAGSFAVQGIVGASYPIAAVPGLSATADYRFTALPERRDARAQVFEGSSEFHAAGDLSGTSEQAFTVGVRYSFGSAPAPASVLVSPPSPTVVAARTYLVFFDWDHADLTDRARQIVAEAARASTGVGVTRIEVDGHTDASGTHAYNQALSLRRATTVSAELVRDGVPSSTISVQGFGETHQLVQTAVGQREPQNRRVEIILR